MGNAEEVFDVDIASLLSIIAGEEKRAGRGEEH